MDEADIEVDAESSVCAAAGVWGESGGCGGAGTAGETRDRDCGENATASGTGCDVLDDSRCDACAATGFSPEATWVSFLARAKCAEDCESRLFTGCEGSLPFHAGSSDGVADRVIWLERCRDTRSGEGTGPGADGSSVLVREAGESNFGSATGAKSAWRRAAKAAKSPESGAGVDGLPF